MNSTLLRTLCAATILFLGCSTSRPTTYQGYVEGDFVHVAAGVGGRLERLAVSRGQTVEANAMLFDREATQEAAAVKQADEAVNVARAQLADLGTGRRGAEIEVMKARPERPPAAEQQSASQLARDAAQLEAGGIARAQLDASRA